MLFLFVRIVTAEGAEEYQIGETLTPTLPAASDGPVNFQSTGPLSLANAVNTTTGEVRDLRGEVGEIIFRLSFAAGEPALSPHDTDRIKVWIDDVRLGPTGAPLTVETATPVTSGLQSLTTGDFLPLLDASRVQWLGVIESPDGVSGIPLGLVHVPTDIFGSTPNQGEGGTGTSEGRLDNQGFFADRHAALIALVSGREATGNPGVGLLGAINGADQLGRDGEAALAADGHAVEPQENPWLAHQTQQTGFSQTVMDKGSAVYAPIGEHRALVGEGAIAGIVNNDIGGNLASEGRNGTSANLEVLNLEKLALQSFKFLPLLLEGGGRVDRSRRYSSRTHCIHSESVSG